MNTVFTCVGARVLQSRVNILRKHGENEKTPTIDHNEIVQVAATEIILLHNVEAHLLGPLVGAFLFRTLS